MTPLAEIIAAQIRADGPMTLADYMAICLLHPGHGYYATRDPFGRAGDFTTAPEIHQLFGEICGLALAQAWIDQGRPAPFTLAEPGPGRGTLMADMRRAIGMVPGMADAAQVTLIEASAHLRGVQRERLGAVTHLDRVDDLPQAPLFLIANEFFDALPIRQFQRVAGGWAERMVTLTDDRLSLALAPPVDRPPHAPDGEIREDCAEALPVIEAVAARIARHGGAAIIIDYGMFDGHGDSLQALRRHAPEGIFDHPGEADLTAHVDFAPLAAAALRAGAAVSTPAPQGAWLDALGIAQRAARLTQAGDAAAEAARLRLTDPAQMGQLFKVLGIWPRDAARVPGLTPLPVHDPGRALDLAPAPAGEPSAGHDTP